MRTRLTLEEHGIANSFGVKVIRLDEMGMEFDLIGIDGAVANAFRRILLAEVHTMAIEKVGVIMNSSVIPDEVLAHRLGLIPIRADPRPFDYIIEGKSKKLAEDTLEFTLKVKCTRNEGASKALIDPDDKYTNHLVYSKHLEWIPIGDQVRLYTKDDIGPVDGDILIAKLNPSQELDLILHCFKGIGKDHAKFSPVATASYRHLPDICLTRDVKGEQAERLVNCFSPGVMKLVKENGETVAKVVDLRLDTSSRNVYRYDDLKDAVVMTKFKDHVIFSIESTGALPPDVLMVEAITVLINKCQIYLMELERLLAGTSH